MASDHGGEVAAEALLREAAAEPDRPRRHLIVAATLRAVLEHEPVVVGGAAEDFYTADAYIETDLDLCGWVLPGERAALERLGFRLRGRHWYHDASSVAVEFPDSVIDGDPERVLRVEISGASVAVIGVDDLYLDRVRQSTADPPGMPQYEAALSIAGANLESMDWPYIEGVLERIRSTDPVLGRLMGETHRRVRDRLKRAIDAGEL
jgi:hypothetical protein